MNRHPPNLSVVILAYQSADIIEQFVDSLISSLEPVEQNWELVLVGNYRKDSDDRTPEVVRSLSAKYQRVQAVTKIKEGMMGWDMKTGLQVATGNVIAVIDGDGQMPAVDVARVYRKLKEDDLDLVKTYRTRRDDGFYRQFVSLTYNALFQLLFPGLKSRDINSKPKVMTRSVYNKLDLRSNGWFIDAEIMIQVRQMKLRIGEVETFFRCIDSRPSFVKPFAILEFLANLFWYRILEFLPSRKS